jgi:mitochondrial chaperone BCS1
MLNLITQLTQTFKSNPLLAGAFSLWGLTVVGWIARSVPKSVFDAIMSQTTTSMTIDSSGHWRVNLAFVSFGHWFTQRRGSNFSRKLSLEYQENYDDLDAPPGGVTQPVEKKPELTLGPGLGFHFFVFNRRLYWVHKTEQPSSGSNIPKYRLLISTFGRSRSPIEKLVKEISPVQDEHKLQTMTISADGDWQIQSVIQKRSLDSIILPPEIKSEMVRSLDEFYQQRQWFLDKGLAHKMCVVFHGQPGCGKTSFVKGLASHYDKNVYTLSLNTVSDRSLPVYLSKVPGGSFVLVEDFDTFSVLKSREAKKEKKSMFEDDGPLTLSGVLNALDGIAALDNIVIFMTTNHLDQIDPAILRDGRTDAIIELKSLTTAGIYEYVKFAYGRDIHYYNFVDVAGCNLHGLLQKHKHDFDGFMQELKEKYAIKEKT